MDEKVIIEQEPGIIKGRQAVLKVVDGQVDQDNLASTLAYHITNADPVGYIKKNRRIEKEKG